MAAKLFIHFYWIIEDGDNISGDGNEDGDDGEVKQEYVKKVYVARPWESLGGLEAVESSIIKDSRPLLRMRISMKRN